MKVVVQRVASASVEVEGRTVSAIGAGLLVLVGVHDLDTDSDADYICRKVLNMRLFPNEQTGKTWDLNVMQKNYEVLLVSQFTLYGILKGNKPDFHVAMGPDRAKSYYASLVERFQRSYKHDSVKGNRQMDQNSTKIMYENHSYGGSAFVIGVLCCVSGNYGVFGAMMKVNLVNDGPVTMQLESPQSLRNNNDSAEVERVL